MFITQFFPDWMCSDEMAHLSDADIRESQPFPPPGPHAQANAAYAAQLLEDDRTSWPASEDEAPQGQSVLDILMGKHR